MSAGPQRWVSRLVQRAKAMPAMMKLEDPNASYVVTGGFGGLGLLVAKFLADRGAKRLLLTSRSGRAPGVAAEQVEELQEMLGAENVIAVKADVSDEASVARMLKDAEASGFPVRGIVHSAGVLDDKMMKGPSTLTTSPTWPPLRNFVPPSSVLERIAPGFESMRG